MSQEIIVFEGVPGAGKTTLARRLEADFKEQTLFLPELNHPDYLPPADIQPWYIDREKVRTRIIQQSHMPRVVIDRGYMSIVSFMAANGDRNDLSNELARELYVPSLVFYFDIDVEESLRRRFTKEEDREKYSLWYDRDFLGRYRHESSSLVERYSSVVVKITADQPVDVVYALVKKSLNLF
jgi:thymidylate kinase